MMMLIFPRSISRSTPLSTLCSPNALWIPRMRIWCSSDFCAGSSAAALIAAPSAHYGSARQVGPLHSPPGRESPSPAFARSFVLQHQDDVGEEVIEHQNRHEAADDRARRANADALGAARGVEPLRAADHRQRREIG